MPEGFLRAAGSRVLGICLLPAVAGLLTGGYALLVEVQRDSGSSDSLIRFAIGSGVWMTVFLFLSPSARSYVIAHECSHLLAAWLTGVRAGRMRIGRDGGSVEVARSSLWIALAPYMIPFYSLMVLLLHTLASLWWDPARWSPLLPVVLGFTWCYHITFTLQALSVGQSDLRPYGWVGALPVILLANLFLLCLALSVVSPRSFSGDLGTLARHQARSHTAVWNVVAGWIGTPHKKIQ